MTDEIYDEIYSRTRLAVGDAGVEKLKRAAVLVCGLGGVGGYAAEALVRAGVGRVDVLDNDRVSPSNLNRQILATLDAVGKLKTEAAYERIKSINPACECEIFNVFYMPDTADDVDLSKYAYIVDAMDTVTAKLTLVERAKAAGAPIISCMGTGNKLGARFEVTDIYRTSVCPLAKVMRKELKARGIRNLRVVYSQEVPIKQTYVPMERGRHIPGSISYAPAIAGLTAASEVIRHILQV